MGSKPATGSGSLKGCHLVLSDASIDVGNVVGFLAGNSAKFRSRFDRFLAEERIETHIARTIGCGAHPDC
jgi:hypothetical protein